MVTEDEAAGLIRDACARLEEEDYRFSVDARGTHWDVYRISIRGEVGLVAFRLVDGQVEIGFCDLKPGITADEIVQALNNQDN